MDNIGPIFFAVLLCLMLLFFCVDFVCGLWFNCETNHFFGDRSGYFCPDCGEQIKEFPVICPSCGSEYKKQPGFCSECGHPFV